MFIPDSMKDPLVDAFNVAPYGTSQAKIADSRLEQARVTEYYPLTHTADILINRAGAGKPINVKVHVHHQGEVSGTGEAHALHKGQLVDVQFVGGSSTGMFNHGTIVGTRFTHSDAKAPGYAPWLQNGTGVVQVHPNKSGGLGNAKHVDGASNVSQTTVARVNKEDWGNEHTVVNGKSITRSQELTQRFSTGVSAAASKL